jgi:hypothetical protein
MSRRKGEITDKHRNRTHPFQVEIAVPRSGLHGAGDIMYRWAAWFDHAMTHHHGGMNWCFLDARTADAFAMDFGGRRVDKPVDPYSLALDQPDCRELERRSRASLFAIERVTGGKAVDTSRPFRGAWKIPFSTFSDPADIARAQSALEKAWAEVASSVPDERHEIERTRLAYLVASFVLVATDEDDLARRAVERFRE